MRLGDFLKIYMQETGYSGRELARRTGLSPQTITNILKGTNSRGEEYYPDTATYKKLADGIGFQASQLMELDKWDQPEMIKARQDKRIKEAMKILDGLNEKELSKAVAMLKLMFDDEM